MGGFSRSLLRQIREVFPASDISVNNPADVSDDVQFVADYLPPTLRLDRMDHVTVVGAANAEVVDGPVVPEDRYWWVSGAQCFHDEGASTHILEVFIRNDNLGVASLIGTSRHFATEFFLAANVLFSPERSFLVPAGWRVRWVLAGTLTGVLTGEATFLELPVMEKSPSI